MGQAGAQESDLDQWPENGAAEPRAQMEGLSHAVVSDLAKIGEGRFGGDGAEVWMSIERLQELRGIRRGQKYSGDDLVRPRNRTTGECRYVRVGRKWLEFLHSGRGRGSRARER